MRQIGLHLEDLDLPSNRIFVRPCVGADRNYPLNPNHDIRTREAAYIEGWDLLVSP
jgi:hypothetical protein